MARENKDYMLTPFGLIKFRDSTGNTLCMRDRELSHLFDFENYICNMFVYDNLPEGIKENYIEMYLQHNGTIGWTKYKDKLTIIEGGYEGPVGAYGLGKNYLGTQNDPEMGTISFEVGTEGVVGYNNATMSPDFDFLFYPYILTEIEKSIIFNIRYARLAPIFEAADSEKKAAIEKLLNDIDDGKMVNVISEDLLNKIEGMKGNDVLQLTDVKEIDKLQYLIKAYEDIKRFYHKKYGLADRGSGKMAQQTVDEVNGTLAADFALPLNMYYYRKLMIEDVNAMYNTNIIVRFSPAWEIEYNKFISTVDEVDEELAQDLDDTTAEDTPEDSPEDSTEGTAEQSDEEDRENED